MYNQLSNSNAVIVIKIITFNEYTLGSLDYYYSNNIIVAALLRT